MGRAAALQPGRQAHRVHQRSRRRRQHLGHGPRRLAPESGHEGDVPPAQQPGVVSGRRIHRRAQALHVDALGRRRRDLARTIAVAAAKGMQMTKRPNDQKDLGEPSFSPDGRYLYYSQDVTPGSSLPVQQGSERRDLRDPPARPPNRRQRTLRDRCRRFDRARRRRPTASRWPSSGACASKSVLFVTDVQSGAERPVWDGLDKRHAGDLGDPRHLSGHRLDAGQRSAVVLWAAGRSSASMSRPGKAAVIPFHVADKRRITEAVRFPVDGRA